MGVRGRREGTKLEGREVMEGGAMARLRGEALKQRRDGAGLRVVEEILCGKSPGDGEGGHYLPTRVREEE